MAGGIIILATFVPGAPSLGLLEQVEPGLPLGYPRCIKGISLVHSNSTDPG